MEFHDVVKQTGSGLRITIPSKEAKFQGIKEGTAVKVLITVLDDTQRTETTLESTQE